MILLIVKLTAYYVRGYLLFCGVGLWLRFFYCSVTTRDRYEKAYILRNTSLAIKNVPLAD